MACHASSTSRSTAAVRSRRLRTPTISASRRFEVKDGAGIDARRVYFRLMLGGITGHKRSRPRYRRRAEAGRGDKGRRRYRARLSSKIRGPQRIAPRRGSNMCWTIGASTSFWSRWRRKLGLQAYAGSIAAHRRAPRPTTAPPCPCRRASRKSRPGLNYIGVVLPVGKMLVEQMRDLAAISHDLGDGDITAYRLAEPAHFRHSRTTRSKSCQSPHRSGGARMARLVDPRRARRLHRVAGLQVRRVSNQEERRRDRGLVSSRRVDARRARSTFTSQAAINSCAQHYIGDVGLIAAQRSDQRGRRQRWTVTTSWSAAAFSRKPRRWPASFIPRLRRRMRRRLWRNC